MPNILDWIDYLVDGAVGWCSNMGDYENFLTEQISKAHRRGAITTETATALYAHFKVG